MFNFLLPFMMHVPKPPIHSFVFVMLSDSRIDIIVPKKEAAYEPPSVGKRVQEPQHICLSIVLLL